jgi:peptidoglycan/LPS O-acetylase OafA/YrhL
MGILRFLLAISVVLAHSTSIGGLELVAPDTAVQAFYVISGFYMALVLDAKYKGKSYKLFISNRLLRIYPIYWIVLSLTFFLIMLSVFLGNSSSKMMVWQEITGHGFQTFYLCLIAVFSNVFFIFQDWLIFLNYDSINEKLQFVSDFHGNRGGLYGLMLVPQAWTIGVELMFYLLAPFLVLG